MATKTITLTGSEIAVTGLGGSHAHIRNDGTEVIYAAKKAGVLAGADGTASIPAGQSNTIRGISGTVYLLGTGSVLIQSDDYETNPFKASAQAGGSGADEVARAAINVHAGKADIHVNAQEKAAWNAKAELSDIPARLQYVNYLGLITDVGNILSNANYSDSAYECVTASAQAAQIGLPSCWWHIKYFRHTDNNGFGCQIAFPIDNPSYLPRYRTSLGSNWDEWKLLADGGNAAALQGHPAADFVLKSDYDELAERVAALETGQV